jgi:hypothetical protein
MQKAVSQGHFHQAWDGDGTSSSFLPQTQMQVQQKWEIRSHDTTARASGIQLRVQLQLEAR